MNKETVIQIALAIVVLVGLYFIGENVFIKTDDNSFEKKISLESGEFVILDEEDIIGSKLVSSDEKIVSVSDNKIIANKKGKALVYAYKDNKKIGVYEVTIKSNEENKVVQDENTKGNEVSEEKIQNKKRYTIKFDSKGGSNVESQTIMEGLTASIPKNPTKKGYVFDGWYLNSSKYDFNNPITSNITLTAKWVKTNSSKKYIVTFDSKGGSNVENQTIIEGLTVSIPKNPTKEGYVFDGWYLNNVRYNFNNPITSNITLSANWVKKSPVDVEPPNGSCEGYYSASSNKSYITIYASDNVGISKYVFNNKDYVTNQTTYTITVDGEINTTHQVKIKVYDTSNNQKEISCQLVHNGIGTISVITDMDEKNKVDKKYLIMQKSTIKVWMEHKNVTRRTSTSPSNYVSSDYYLTYIWLKDPYNQIKSQVANDIHKLDKYNNYAETYQEIPSSILNDALNENLSLNSKSLIAINASSQSGAMVNPYYIQNGKLKTTLVSGKHNTYKDTTQVIYNYHDTREINAHSQYVYAITKDGNLKYYNFVKKVDSPYNEKVYNSIINDQPKYTFSLNPPLINESKGVYEGNTFSMRQALCQVDQNNFIILTSNYKVGKDRPVKNQSSTSDYVDGTNTGLQSQSLLEELLKLGCKTAVNLDGGGSVALIVKKDKNIKIVSGDNRVTPDILYFHE